jgi:CRP-like cAMP-binding protein
MDEPHERLLQRLALLGRLNEKEEADLGDLPLRVRDYAKGSDLVRQGQEPTECCLILRGLACRYKFVAGDKRQILSLHFASDMPDLQGLHLDVMDHGISAIVEVRAAFIPHQAVHALTRRHPHIGDLFDKHTLIDAAIFRDWIANVGRRSGYQRMAHLFCELFVRMRKLGLADYHTFRLPMTQAELADACGLSNVHVNRVLQRLRRNGLIVSTGNVHAIADWNRLREAGDFDEVYLHQA